MRKSACRLFEMGIVAVGFPPEGDPGGIPRLVVPEPGTLPHSAGS